MPTAPHGFFRVAAAAPRVAIADPEQNLAHTLHFLERARAQGAQLVVFPELGLTGYTCADLFFSLSTLVAGAERALGRLLEATAGDPAVVVVGLPVLQDSLLFNAAAVCQAGRLLGVVPKSHLPGYREFYEERWFSPASEARSPELRLAGQPAPFGADLLFALEGEPAVALAVELCEDLWVPVPPSSRHAQAGATLIANPSASPDVVGKAEYRRKLVEVQSGRALCAYVYAGCGVHESTTDLVFAGHLLVAENGTLLAESERFARQGQLLCTDVDLERLQAERVRQTSFAEGSVPQRRRIALSPIPPPEPHRLLRRIDPHPFVPQDPATLDERCREVFSIQTAGLARRLEHVGVKRVVLGVSGGLDSTLALLVCLRTFELLGLDRTGIRALSMPAFGTTATTRDSARRLATALGVDFREIDIRAACIQHMADIGLPEGDRESVAYQNVQARERTQVLMDVANLEGGLVVGTGDLSELALGFCTFAGDHIAMYNVNGSIPKTLVRQLILWVASHHADPEAAAVLRQVLDTPVSPELVPPDAQGRIAQRTEEIVGPYELVDFYLHGLVRLSASPRKLLFLAEQAFAGSYDRATLRRWLCDFLRRFFGAQFKRSVLPDGPKVGSVSLSPRGDWRMPSDASVAAFLADLDRT